MTLMLVEPNGQMMMTPGMTKCYANKEFKVYKSSFDNHNYVVIKRNDRTCAIVEDYTINTLVFDHKYEGKFK